MILSGRQGQRERQPSERGRPPGRREVSSPPRSGNLNARFVGWSLSGGSHMMVRRRRKPVRASPVWRHENTYLYKVPERLIKLSNTHYHARARLTAKSRRPSEADPVGGNPAAWRGPHRGTLGPSPPPSGRGPIERTRADAPHLRRHLHKAHAASPRGVAHGRGPRLAPGLLRARG